MTRHRGHGVQENSKITLRGLLGGTDYTREMEILRKEAKETRRGLQAWYAIWKYIWIQTTVQAWYMFITLASLRLQEFLSLFVGSLSPRSHRIRKAMLSHSETTYCPKRLAQLKYKWIPWESDRARRRPRSGGGGNWEAPHPLLHHNPFPSHSFWSSHHATL